MASELKTLQVVCKDRPGVNELSVEDVLKIGRDGVAVIDWSSVKPSGGFFIYPGLYYYDPTSDTVTSLWGRYVGRDYPKLYPKYEIVESAPDHLVVRRYDGQTFKFVSNFIGEVVENIYLNPGKSLWDVVVLESVVEARDDPGEYRDEEYRYWFAEKVVLTVGFLTYVCGLVGLRSH